MNYLIEYLGKFKFIFETVLGYVSGDQMGSFEAKKRSRNSHAWVPLKSAKENTVGAVIRVAYRRNLPILKVLSHLS